VREGCFVLPILSKWKVSKGHVQTIRCLPHILGLLLQLCNVSRVCKVDTSTWMFVKVPVIPAGSFLSKIRDTTADTCHIQPVTSKDLDLRQKLFCIYRQ